MVMDLPLTVRRNEVVRLLNRASERCRSGSDIVSALQLAAGVEPAMISDDFYPALLLLEGEKRFIFGLSWDYLEAVAGEDLADFEVEDVSEWLARVARLAQWA
jgi:hypothetical protein